jgi:hypothetical protein
MLSMFSQFLSYRHIKKESQVHGMELGFYLHIWEDMSYLL